MASAVEQQPQDGITGLIERVTFHSEETGFAVLRVKAKGHRDLVTVVGSLPRSTQGSGSRLRADGCGTMNMDYSSRRSS